MNERRIVHIVDDDAAIRRSTSFILKTSGYRAATYASGASFLKEVRHLQPGCVLLDIRMPEIDGLQVQEALIERGVTMPVIFLTGHGDVPTAVKVMKRGAIELIEKPFERDTLLRAVEEAFRQLDERQSRELRAQEARVLLAGLSQREHEVLEGLVKGLANKSIAYDLGISARTVEVHRANLMIKLGVHTLSDALRIAFAANVDGEAE